MHWIITINEDLLLKIKKNIIVSFSLFFFFFFFSPLSIQ